MFSGILWHIFSQKILGGPFPDANNSFTEMICHIVSNGLPFSFSLLNLSIPEQVIILNFQAGPAFLVARWLPELYNCILASQQPLPRKHLFPVIIVNTWR